MRYRSTFGRVEICQTGLIVGSATKQKEETLKTYLEDAAKKALVRANGNSALSIALSLMNMPKIKFKFNRGTEEFDCIALFDEARNLVEIELINTHVSGKITFNKR